MAAQSLRYRLAKPLLYTRRLLNALDGSKQEKGFRILLFHSIPDHQLPVFEDLMQHIMADHEIVCPGEVESILAGQTAAQHGRTRILVTFDDGFRSQVATAEKVLDRYAIKAIFFVCPGLMNIPVGRQDEAVAKYVFDGRLSEAVPAETKLMSWSATESLLASGHTIGSHTALHRRLSELAPEELDAEIVGSADLLEQRLGVPIRWFAYPFGDIESVSESSYGLIRKRYSYCCSGIRGFNADDTYPLGLLRDCLDPLGPVEYQDFVLLGGLDLLYRSRARKLQDMARRAKHGSRQWTSL